MHLILSIIDNGMLIFFILFILSYLISTSVSSDENQLKFKLIATTVNFVFFYIIAGTTPMY